jgi:hypothetical protein
MKRNRFRARIGAVALLVLIAMHTAFGLEMKPHGEAHLYDTPTQRRDIDGFMLAEGINCGMLLEIEASVGEADAASFSDAALATFELGIEAELTPWLTAEAVLLWEEDDTEPVELDVGAITVGGTEAKPFRVTAGKVYVPFGQFASHFVSDPLTLELGETRESAVLAGYKNERVAMWAGLFNGDVDEAGDDDHAADAVASLSMAPTDWLRIGASWLSDIGESDGIQESILEALASTNAPAYEHVDAAACFIRLEVGHATVDIEYLEALHDFEAGILNDVSLRPAAWNAELAIGLGDAMECAVKCEGTDEWPGMPEIQYGAVWAYGITEGASLAVEFLHGEFEDDQDDRNVVTIQLALEM